MSRGREDTDKMVNGKLVGPDHLDQAFALLGFIMAELPLLVDPAELKIIDCHAGKPGLHTNWAVVYRGGIIKDRFATDAVAMLWVKSQLVDGDAVILRRHDTISDPWSGATDVSRSVH
jgi:hypothetical protein